MLKYESSLATASTFPLLALRQYTGFERPLPSITTNPDARPPSAREREKLFYLLSGYRLLDVLYLVKNNLEKVEAPSHRQQPFLGEPEMLLSKGWGHLHD